MKKWIVPLLSLLLIALLLLISSPFNIFKPSMNRQESGERYGLLFIQDDGKEEQTDPHFILILKRLRGKLDEWIGSINDRIEREDITRLEVRFSEVLRSILRWVREKVDAKIASSEKGKTQEDTSDNVSIPQVGCYCAVLDIAVGKRLTLRDIEVAKIISGAGR